jgi:carbon storage regulator
MLVIRRREGESFLVGDSIEIEVLEVGGHQVKLGIRAPREIPVVRKEVEITRRQNRAAAALAAARWRGVLETSFQALSAHTDKPHE